MQTHSTTERVGHTPGPWKVKVPVGTWIQTAGDPYGHGPMHVADVRGWGHLTGRGGGCAFNEDKAVEIQNANARLIAAAPDLLASVREFVALYAGVRDAILSDSVREKLARADAVIAKAEGVA